MNTLFWIGVVYLTFVFFLIWWLKPDKKWADIARFEARWFQDKQMDHKRGSSEWNMAVIYGADAEEASKCKHPISMTTRIHLISVGLLMIAPRIIYWFL